MPEKKNNFAHLERLDFCWTIVSSFEVFWPLEKHVQLHKAINFSVIAKPAVHQPEVTSQRVLQGYYPAKWPAIVSYIVLALPSSGLPSSGLPSILLWQCFTMRSEPFFCIPSTRPRQQPLGQPLATIVDRGLHVRRSIDI